MFLTQALAQFDQAEAVYNDTVVLVTQTLAGVGVDVWKDDGPHHHHVLTLDEAQFVLARLAPWALFSYGWRQRTLQQV